MHTDAGGGRGADKVRSLYSNMLGERPYQPDVIIKNKVSDNVLGLFNRNFCNARNNQSLFDTFKADLENGSFSVVLPGNVRLTAADAVDKLASFMTHGEKTTYEDLDDKGKAKVINLVSMLNRQNAEIGEKAEALAADAQGRDAKIEFGGGFTKRQFSLAFEENNTLLLVRCEAERTLETLRVNSGAGFENVPVGPGSNVTAGYEVRISTEEIDRLARIGSLDNNLFWHYNDQDIQNHINNLEGAPNPHAHSQIGNVLGDFKIQGPKLGCSTGFKLTVN